MSRPRMASCCKHDEIKPYATALLGHSEGGLLALAAAAAMGKRAPAWAGAGGHARPAAGRDRARADRPQRADRAVAERMMAAIIATGHVPADMPRELQLSSRPMPGRSCKAAS